MRGYVPEAAKPKAEFDVLKEAQVEKAEKLKQLDQFAERFAKLQEQAAQMSTTSAKDRFNQLHNLVESLAEQQNEFLTYVQNKIYQADEGGFYHGEVPKDLLSRINEVATVSHILEVRANVEYNDMLPKMQTLSEAREQHRDELENMNTVVDKTSGVKVAGVQQFEVDPNTDLGKTAIDDLRADLNTSQGEVFSSRSKDQVISETVKQEPENFIPTQIDTKVDRDEHIFTTPDINADTIREELIKTKIEAPKTIVKDVRTTKVGGPGTVVEDLPFAKPEDVIALDPDVTEKTIVEPAAQDQTVVDDKIGAKVFANEVERISGRAQKTQVDTHPLSELIGDEEVTQVARPPKAA